MKVRMLENQGSYRRGLVYDLPELKAAIMMRLRLATPARNIHVIRLAESLKNVSVDKAYRVATNPQTYIDKGEPL